MKRLSALLHHPYTGIILYLFCYFLLSLTFLIEFPLVHSDESWLVGLTRNMAENGSFSVTEPFFDARPRYPHAIKLLFHALQMLFLQISGYSVFSVRLLSLIAGVISLFFFYLTARKLLPRTIYAFLLTVMFSLDIQFIYASHMARQESLLLLSLALCLFLFFKNDNPNTGKTAFSLALVTGISIGLHPNSFLLACMTGALYLARYLTHPADIKKPLLTYIGITGAFALLFVALSFSFDSRFLFHYFSNGADEFGIDALPGSRFSALFGFFKRLFLQEGGTYFVADIRLQFILFPIAALFLLFFFLVMRKEAETQRFCRNILSLLLAGLGLIAGIFLIGRYSQLSILFLFPVGWLLTGLFLQIFEDTRITLGGTVLLLLLTAFLSAQNIKPQLTEETYAQYLTQLSEYVPANEPVIANLNTDFYFENGKLHDYRNLPYVMQAEGNLDAYIEKNEIAYILYTDELDYYFAHRPYYNTIYGNIMFAEALLDYCETQCDYVGSFENAAYAPRILELIGNEDYATVRIYRTRYAAD